jgi:hypothetical protein
MISRGACAGRAGYSVGVGVTGASTPPSRCSCPG